MEAELTLLLAATRNSARGEAIDELSVLGCEGGNGAEVISALATDVERYDLIVNGVPPELISDQPVWLDQVYI